MTRPGTRHSVTVEIAGVVCSIRCRYLKPIVWARESHPAFLSTNCPDIDLTISYSDAYWRRGLPWIAQDTVVDAPVVSRRGESLLVQTTYYRAQIDLARGLANVSMASGFRVHGLLRTLYALFLVPRGSLLVQAVRVVVEPTAYLLFGLPEEEKTRLRRDARDLEVFDGFLAVVRQDGHYVSFATPFHDGETPLALRLAAPITASYLFRPDAGPTPQLLNSAQALTRWLPYVAVVDRERSVVERVLDSSTQLVQMLPCYQWSGTPGRGFWDHAGPLA